MPDHPDIPVEEVLEGSENRFGQVIALAIVLTTLLAALCGYLQARSLNRGDDALSRGQQWGALSVQFAAENQQTAQLMLGRYHRAEGERLQASYLTGLGLFGSAPPSQTSAAQRLAQVAASTDSDSKALAQGIRREFATVHAVDDPALLDRKALTVGDGERCPLPGWAQGDRMLSRIPGAVGDNSRGEGPNQDPAFPAVYYADGRRQIYQLDGLRDAANAESAQSEKQFTRYAVSLATLAVAVFMLGYSLTPHGRHHRKLYAAVAGLLVFGASAWGVYATVRSPHEAAPESMAAYADGRVAFDRGDYRLATRYLTCSIEQDPSFAPAYVWRAAAAAGTVQTLYQLTPAQLRQSVADDERAVGLGSTEPEGLNQLSAGLFVAGLSRDDLGLVERSESFMARARRRDPANPTIALNFAEDEVMLGHTAAEAYGAVGAERIAQTVPVAARAALSSLESDLETPLGRRRAGQLLAAKQLLTAALSRGAAPAGPGVSVRTLAGLGAPSLSVSVQGGTAPGQLEFFLNGARGFNPARDRLYAVWYRSTNPGWQEIEGATAPVALAANPSGTPFSIATVYGQCLDARRYRLELYVNGRLTSTTDALSHSPALQYAHLRDMNFSLCHPSGWRPVSSWQPGLIEGFESQSRKSGMLVVDASSAADSPRLIGRVLAGLGNRIPSGLHLALRLPGNAFGGGLCRPYVQEDRYPGGMLAAGVGRDAFGRQLVGLVYAPQASFADQGSAPSLASDLFTSMISSAAPTGSAC